MKKGWIALDIDGTVTDSKHLIPDKLHRFLEGLVGTWNIAFVTGRPFTFAYETLKVFAFPFFFLGQNGTLALEMPKRRELFTDYLEPSSLPLIEEAAKGLVSDFLIYAGYEKGDICYYRPYLLKPEDESYLEDVKKRQEKDWVSYRSFQEIGPFPLVKCFGEEETMRTLQKKLSEKKVFELSIVKDPFAKGIFMLLITKKGVCKGKALEKLIAKYDRGKWLIGAGDDENDIPLLEVCDYKIAMEHAPSSLKKKADFIAPLREKGGLVTALEWALQKCS